MEKQIKNLAKQKGKKMRPKDMFSTQKRSPLNFRVNDIVHKKHPLVILANKIDWDRFDKDFGSKYDEKKGRPGLSTRLMVGLQCLKYIYNLSDEKTIEMFKESPQWQYFCGQPFYSYEDPCDRSSLTNWRKRMGAEKIEVLLEETIDLALREDFVKKKEFENVVVDTTVQEKAIAFPTDSRLYYKALKTLVHRAKKEGLVLRQSYKRKAKECLFKNARYAHTRKIRLARKQQRKLHTYLGRVIRDVTRKGGPKFLEENTSLKRCLSLCVRIYNQKRGDKNKVYSVHAPEVYCIGKGKAHKKYEFGNKVSVATSSKNCWVLGVKSFEKNVSDVHSLKPALSQVESLTKVKAKNLYVDKGYRGKEHHPSGVNVHIGGMSKTLSPYKRKLHRRRSSVEAIIGHMKIDSRMGRNFLLGSQGDAITYYK